MPDESPSTASGGSSGKQADAIPKTPDATPSAANRESGPAAQAQSAGEGVVKYTLEELRAGARSLLGVSRHVVAGAFSMEEDVLVTLDEAKRQVERFLSEEVESGS